MSRIARVCGVLWLVAAVAATSCARDPETETREQIAAGDAYVKEGKHAEAIVAYRNALRVDPRQGDVRAKLAAAYESSGDLRNALQEAVRAADLLPDDADAQLRAARLLLRSGQFQDARTRASNVLAKNPRHVDALIVMGNAMAGLKDFDGAIEQIEEAIDQNPGRVLTYSNLGALYAAKGDRDAAQKVLQRAIEVDPQSSLAHLGMANFYWSARDFTAAERELKAALAIEDSAQAHQVLGTFYMSQGRYAEAEPHVVAYARMSGTAPPKFVLGDFYTRTGRFDEAVKVYQGLVDAGQERDAAEVRLATLEFVTNRKAEAYRRLDGVLERVSTHREAQSVKARFLVAEGKYAEAIAVADTAIAADPKAMATRYVRGVALEAAGSFEQAAQAFEDILKDAPSSTPAQIRLARLRLRSGDAQGAAVLLRTGIAAGARTADVLQLYAQALLRSGSIEAAERELLGLVDADPNSSGVHALLGGLYQSRRDLPRARQSYETALKLDPGSVMAARGLVTLDIAARQSAAARTRVDTLLARSPKDPEALILAGDMHAALGDMAKAEQLFREVIEIDEGSMVAYTKLGAIYASQNRLDDAKKIYESAAARQSRPVAARTMIGIILSRQGRLSEARQHYEEAVKLSPRASVASNNLAWLYAESGENLETALQLAQAAKAELPNNPDVADTLGWVYYKSNFASLAVTALREAAELNPRSPDIQYHLGLAHLKAGNRTEAREALQRVLQLDPKFASADDVRRALATAGQAE